MVTKDEIIKELKEELCDQRKYNNDANKKIQKLEFVLAKMQDSAFIKMDKEMLEKFKEFCKNG